METTQLSEQKEVQGGGETRSPAKKKEKRGLPAFPLAKKRKKWLRLAALLAVAGLGVYWFTHRAPAGAAGGPAGQYVPDTVQRRDLTVSVSGTGTIAPIDSYQVRALTTGEVLESPFEVGDRVEKGALLYRLDAGDAETAIQQAQAGVEQARLNVEQTRLAAEQANRGVEQAQRGVEQAGRGVEQAGRGVEQAQRTVEQAEEGVEQAEKGVEQAQRAVEQAEKGVEQAQKGVRQAEKGVEQARKNYDDYVQSLTVRAPEGGVVQKVLVQRGDLLSPGSPVAEIADTSTLKLSLPFHSADVQRLTVGQSAQVTVTGTLETLPATVESIAEADLPGTGSTLVRRVTLRLDNPGVLTAANSATAAVGDVSCAGSGSFEEVMRRTVTAQTAGQVVELPIAVGSRVSEGSALAVLGGSTVQNSLDELERAQDAARDGVTAAQDEVAAAQDKVVAARDGVAAARDAVKTAQDGVTSARDGVASAQDAVTSAQDAEENARDVVTNARDAAENAQITLQNAQLALKNAELALQNARDALDNYTITAPISGTVIEKNIKAGDKVDGIESGSLAVIYDMSCLKLEMNISELDLSKVRDGQTVEITADAIPGQTFLGTVDRVSINGTTTNGFTTYPAAILLEDYGGLNPGMNVSAGIIVDHVENALSIPAAAVQRGDTVLIPLEGALAEDGVTIADPTKVEERAVTLGGGDKDYIEVTSGLNEGDVILVPAQGMGG